MEVLYCHYCHLTGVAIKPSTFVLTDKKVKCLKIFTWTRDVANIWRRKSWTFTPVLVWYLGKVLHLIPLDLDQHEQERSANCFCWIFYTVLLKLEPNPLMLDPDMLSLDPDPLSLDPDPLLLDPDPLLLDPDPLLLNPDSLLLDPEPLLLDPDLLSLDPDQLQLWCSLICWSVDLFPWRKHHRPQSTRKKEEKYLKKSMVMGSILSLGTNSICLKTALIVPDANHWKKEWLVTWGSSDTKHKLLQSE